jgi:hypothetical protein
VLSGRHRAAVSSPFRPIAILWNLLSPDTSPPSTTMAYLRRLMATSSSSYLHPIIIAVFICDITTIVTVFHYFLHIISHWCRKAIVSWDKITIQNTYITK